MASLLSLTIRGAVPHPRSLRDDPLPVRLHDPARWFPSANTEWYQFFDLAAAHQGIVPADIMEDAELVKALPVFFRTLRGQKPTAEELRRIAEKIRKAGK